MRKETFGEVRLVINLHSDSDFKICAKFVTLLPHRPHCGPQENVFWENQAEIAVQNVDLHAVGVARQRFICPCIRSLLETLLVTNYVMFKE